MATVEEALLADLRLQTDKWNNALLGAAKEAKVFTDKTGKLSDEVKKNWDKALDGLAGDAKKAFEQAGKSGKKAGDEVAKGASEAEKELEEAVRLAPNNPYFLFMLTKLHQERGELRQATRGAQRLIKLRPQNPMYRMLLRELRKGEAPLF